MRTIANILLLSTLSAMVLPSAFAQGSDTLDLEPLTAWTRIPTAPASTPQARYWHEMVYDSVRGEVLIVGGTGGSGKPRPSDTWGWDGQQWSLRHVTGVNRGLFGLAFDPLRGVAVLHGGLGPSAVSGVTFEWDGQDWLVFSGVGGGPGVRALATMAYHPGRQRILLHGGSPRLPPSALFDDTWEFDGVSWTEIAGAGGPPRFGGRMVYDPKREVMVLYGGTDGYASEPVDTWEFSNGQWHQVATAGPSGCSLLQMYYDSAREVVVMQREGRWYGDFPPGTPLTFDDNTNTWEWDGISWRQRHSLVPPRQQVVAAAAAYDTGRGRWVRFGGANDPAGSRWAGQETWEYGSFERMRLGRPSVSEGGDVRVIWAGGVPPFQVQACTSLPDDDWHHVGTPTAQLHAIMPANGTQEFFRVTMEESMISGTEVHVAWLAQPPPTTNISGNIKFAGWERLWYDDADDDRLDGYVTLFIDALHDPQGKLLEAGGAVEIREQLDSYTLDDFLNGTFDTNLVVQGAILWEGRWTATPPESANAVAMDSTGLTAFYMHQASEDPDAHPFFVRLHDPGP